MRGLLAVLGVTAIAAWMPVGAHADIDEQIASITMRLTGSPRDAALLLKRGELHRVHADWRLAAADFDRAEALDPALALVDLARGHLLLDEGRPAEAIVRIERFVQAHPHDARASALLAETLTILEKPRESARAWDRALTEASTDEPLRPDWAFARERALRQAGLTASAPPLPRADSVHPAVPDRRPAPAILLRGPYLQLGTPTSIVVRWRTDVETDSVVSYGLAGSRNVRRLRDLRRVTDHVVTLSGLSPGTSYAYAIGSSTQTLDAGPEDTFRTSPEPGAPSATRIWVLGDSGTADGNAMAVRDAYAGFTGARGTDVWLMLGDNAYATGTDTDYQRAVFEMYPAMLRRLPLWPTLGNHDGLSADSSTESGPYYDLFTLPRRGEAGGVPSSTEAYYSFDYADVHFVCLDSYDTSRAPGAPMLTWLERDLAATRQDWVIAFWHHPPYSKGSHDSDGEIELVEMRENVLPILEAQGVDLVLSGHSHSYERTFLLDGHYGPSWTFLDTHKKDGGDGRPSGNGAYVKPGAAGAPNSGAVYVVAGSSGQLGGGSLDHPAMYVSLDRLGSLVLDIDGGRLDASFLDDRGTVADSFSIAKTGAGVVDPQPRGGAKRP
jgi:tetratricopeptide (TPR) repeat protein